MVKKKMIKLRERIKKIADELNLDVEFQSVWLSKDNYSLITELYWRGEIYIAVGTAHSLTNEQILKMLLNMNNILFNIKKIKEM